MPGSRRFVIVGASLAGAKAAETLRMEGFDGEIVLVGEEEVRPYERPPLSKEYLRGEKSFDDLAVHGEDFYDENEIELLTSTKVTSIDVSTSKIELASGKQLAYDQLLLATGALPRRLEVPGVDLGGVHYLRSLSDADALRQAISTSLPLVVIGAGWIGTEVAASARQLGADVALVETAPLPLDRVLGARVGEIYRNLHASHGVDLHFGVGVDSLRGADRVEEVRLSDGTLLPAGVVVVGVGVLPRIELARHANLEIDNGILVDEHLSTSAPGVFAAGDVADVFYPLYGTHIRLEHWSAALNQGVVAARNMLGMPEAYDKVPYFFSDQYDFGMEYRGWAPSFDEVLLRGEYEQGEFIAFWLHQGKVLAAMNVNIWDQGDALETLVRSKTPVEAEKLVDTSVDLTTLTTLP